MLTRARILELFGELDAELCDVGVRGDVFIVGGAAMAVAYDARPSTQDVDGIWHPSREVREAAHRVAARHDDLDEDWLNDGAKGFLPAEGRGEKPVVYEGDCLTVSAGSPEYLLATKLLASRVSRDEDDILLLYERCGFTTADDGLDLLDRYYPGRPIEAMVRFFLEELLAGLSWPGHGRFLSPAVRRVDPCPTSDTVSGTGAPIRYGAESQASRSARSSTTCCPSSGTTRRTEWFTSTLTASVRASCGRSCGSRPNSCLRTQTRGPRRTTRIELLSSERRMRSSRW